MGTKEQLKKYNKEQIQDRVNFLKNELMLRIEGIVSGEKRIVYERTTLNNLESDFDEENDDEIAELKDIIKQGQETITSIKEAIQHMVIEIIELAGHIATMK